MKLLTALQRKKLIENFHKSEANDNAIDHSPVVKMFNPCGSATWLFHEMNPDGDLLFGLCDLGMGSPEIGHVSLAELEAIELPLGMKIERDRHFKSNVSITEWAVESREQGHISA